jgi:hypothetical protein
MFAMLEIREVDLAQSTSLILQVGDLKSPLYFWFE